MLLCSASPLTTYRPLPCISAVGLRYQSSTRVLGRADEGARSSRSPSPPLPAADTSILGEWMEVPDLTPEPGDSAAGDRDASEQGLADGAEEAVVEESARELPSWSHSLRPTRSLTPLTHSPCHLCPVPVRVIMRAFPFPPPPALPTVCRTTAVGAVASHKGKLLDRGTHENIEGLVAMLVRRGAQSPQKTCMSWRRLIGMVQWTACCGSKLRRPGSRLTRRSWRQLPSRPGTLCPGALSCRQA